MKTVLVLIDGMRPDAIKDHPIAMDMMRKGSFSLEAQTVMPSVTLPCHMSLFHSVDPGRHGNTTNTYMPQVRPINGICEVLRPAGRKCAFFYNWEQLRDLARPNMLAHSFFMAGKYHKGWYEEANVEVTDAAINYITETAPDFSFVYLGWVDEAGHKYGWMSDEYMRAVDESWKQIQRIRDILTDEYTLIVIADHGGHDRTHGTEMMEDMTIPVIIEGKDFKPEKELSNVSIKDIAPTITELVGLEPDEDWEGKSLI